MNLFGIKLPIIEFYLTSEHGGSLQRLKKKGDTENKSCGPLS